jgi:hypothetical protein
MINISNKVEERKAAQKSRMDVADPVALSLRSNAVELRAIADSLPAAAADHLYVIAAELERIATLIEDAGRQD